MSGNVAHVDKGCMSAYFWNRTLTFTMPRVVVVQIWQLGLIYRLLQLVVLAYLVWGLWWNNGWAKKEVPTQQINAWTEPGSVLAAMTVANGSDTFGYCNNETYAFHYSAAYNYVNPTCDLLHNIGHVVFRHVLRREKEQQDGARHKGGGRVYASAAHTNMGNGRAAGKVKLVSVALCPQTQLPSRL